LEQPGNEERHEGLFCLPAGLVAVVALGLLSRLRPIGWFLYDKTLGDILYAVAVYLALALLLFRWRSYWVALLALVLCMAVEAFQTTGIPASYSHIAGVRWLLGTTFSWHDVECLVVGVRHGDPSENKLKRVAITRREP
jgi:hypothetical protein